MPTHHPEQAHATRAQTALALARTRTRTAPAPAPAPNRTRTRTGTGKPARLRRFVINVRRFALTRQPLVIGRSYLSSITMTSP
jgi:hypothetical protein